MGTTWAVSEAKAISNVRYRTSGKQQEYLVYDLGQEEEAEVSWEAELGW